MRNDSTNSDRLPPHSLEAEQGVLGCVLLAPGEALNQLAERRAAAEWFYDLRHQHIFHCMRALADAGKPVDTIALYEALRERGWLEQVDGTAYLGTLQDATPTAANLGYYLDLLKEKFQRRRLLALCAETTQRVWDAEWTLPRLLHTAGEDFEKLTETATEATEKTMKEIIHGVITDMEEHVYRRGKTQMRGLPTGPEGNHLDKYLRGIREDWYVVLAGRPGTGKTSLAMNIVEHLACDYVWHEDTGERDAEGHPVTTPRKGIPIGVFSMEMSEQSLGYRLLFGRAGVDSGQYYTGYAEGKNVDLEERRFVLASGSLSKAPIIVDDAPGQSIGQMAAKARRWAKQYGIKLFVLDYLQLTDGDNPRDDARVKLGKVSKKLMALKKQLKIPWLVLAQMNRDIEKSESKRKPMLSDLKDCGDIEQDAEVVMMLYKPDRRSLDDAPDGQKSDNELLLEYCAKNEHGEAIWSMKGERVDVFLAKNRYGPTGTAEFIFQKNLCRFEDWHAWKVRMGAEARKEGERARNLPTNEELGIQDNEHGK